jgi:ABC-type antimicrobial peptide transport system permease subunit
MVGASSIALLLTIVGIIGSVTYSVSRRKFEMAIRLSLGASAASVTRLVVSAMLRAIGIGAVLGLGLSLVGTGLLQGLLYGVGPFDIPAYVISAILLGGGAAVAAFLPARRVGRADLTTVLRDG